MKEIKQIIPNLKTISKEDFLDFMKLSIERMCKKELDRLNRVIKLSLLINAYYHYSMTVLHGSISSKENTYEEAVKTSELINFFFEDRSKPDDFLHRKDEEANKAIEEYKIYCKYIEVGTIAGLNKQSMEAFCKHVEHNWSIIGLKSTFLFHNKNYIENVYMHLLKMMTYDQLKKSFVNYSLFSNETKKVDSVLFRRTIIQIESLYRQINKKQERRKISSN